MKFKFDDPPERNKKKREPMSVKQMTSDQIQDDLEQINRQWAGGIPPEQVDRVNALKSELKRRGEQARAVRPQANGNGVNGKQRNVKSMTDDQLQKELSVLAETMERSDEDAQSRFADVRYELRQRSARAEPSTPSVSPRSIEIPDASEEEVVTKGRDVASPSTTVARKIPVGVKGFSAQVGAKGVVLRYTAQDQYGNIAQVAGMLTWDEADQLVAQIQAAIYEGKSMTKASS